MEKLLQAVKSLISDIEGMRCALPLSMSDYDDSGHWFGDFSSGSSDNQELENVCIEWPNLSISVADLKKILEEHESGPVVEGELTKPMLQQQPAWPGKGDKMRFLDKNGYDLDREMARKHFTEGQIVTVKDISIRSFAHSIQFVESGEAWFNGVMFEWVSHG